MLGAHRDRQEVLLSKEEKESCRMPVESCRRAYFDDILLDAL